jgi:hypothetical protein
MAARKSTPAKPTAAAKKQELLPELQRLPEQV